MAQKVSNGAIGKSPGIDKINRAQKEGLYCSASQTMERLVCEKNQPMQPPVNLSFDGCRRAVHELMNRLEEKR